MNVQGKVALVTGGAHRVGKAITMTLARMGAHVVVNYHSSQQAAEQTVAEVAQLGVEGLSIQCDVGDWTSVQGMTQAILHRFGGVDIIVNGRRIIFGKMAFPADDLEVWHRVTGISINGPFYVCNSLTPGMRTRGGGVIVNIVDLSAWYPWPGLTAHSVGKAGLLALTRQLALELAPDIRANAVAAGPVLPPPSMSDSRAEAVAQRTLLERWGSANDVAQAVKFLVEADYVTGEVLTVDGGERCGRYKLARTTA